MKRAGREGDKEGENGGAEGGKCREVYNHLHVVTNYIWIT